ncbi:response regulator [Niabella insulamsoli]|uniref:response regulator transcription factor n=1 Tax=Niabella insulamsoli TaxID=3144874 RepID=UPI0031FD0801
MKAHLAIVDDNHFLIKSIQERLSFFDDMKISFTARDGMECIGRLQENANIDLILMDIEMPKKNGIETCALIKQKHPQIKIIMLTVIDDDEHIFKAIQSGADGYLLKETGPEELHKAILQTLEGGAAMTPSVAMKTLRLLRNPLPDEAQASDEDVNLSQREVEVLEQLSKGLSYTMIAENLFISPSTVRKHIEHIYHKLQVHSKVEAVRLAQKRRII